MTSLVSMLALVACGGASSSTVRPSIAPRPRTFADVARDVRETLCATDYAQVPEGEPCPVELRLEEVPELEGGLSAAVISTDFQTSYGGGYLWTALAVRMGDRVETTHLAHAYSPGMLAMSADLSVEARSDDVLPGGHPELVVDVETTGSDADVGYCDDSYSSDRAVIVCSIDSGALRCAFAHYASSRVSEHEACNDTDDDDGDGNDDEPLAGDRAHTEVRGHRCTLSFEAGAAIFACDDEGDAPPFRGAVGVRTLLDRADLAWPARWSPLFGNAG